MNLYLFLAIISFTTSVCMIALVFIVYRKNFHRVFRRRQRNDLVYRLDRIEEIIDENYNHIITLLIERTPSINKEESKVKQTLNRCKNFVTETLQQFDMPNMSYEEFMMESYDFKMGASYGKVENLKRINEILQS